MDPGTIEKLKRVNLAFYERFGPDFSSTRSGAWRGWERLLERFDAPISVVDLGCGNARFLDAMKARGIAGRYVGVDSSRALLDIARRRHPDAELREADVLDVDVEADLVVAFGLMHHLPGGENRRRLVETAARLGTTVALTFWRFDGNPRFERKKRPFREIGVDPDAVEPGDFLLRWKEDALRYCHHTSDEEIEALIAASGRREVDRYEADGGLNLYSVLGDR